MMDFKDYISGDELVLVDFYAAWCRPCKSMHAVLDEFKSLTSDKIRILKLDIDSPANAQKVQEYHVGSVPTLMFFRGGKVLWRSSGAISAAELKKLYDKLIAEGASASASVSGAATSDK